MEDVLPAESVLGVAPMAEQQPVWWSGVGGCRRPSEPMRVRGRHEGFEPLVSWRLAWRTRFGGPRRPPPLL